MLLYGLSSIPIQLLILCHPLASFVLHAEHNIVHLCFLQKPVPFVKMSGSIFRRVASNGQLWKSSGVATGIVSSKRKKGYTESAPYLNLASGNGLYSYIHLQVTCYGI